MTTDPSKEPTGMDGQRRWRHSSLRRTAQASARLGRRYCELFVALTGATALSLAAATGKWEVVAGVAGGLVSLLLLVRFPRVHWLMFFGIMPWFFRQSDVGVSLFDAAFAVYLATLLGGWWVRALLSRQQEILWERKDVFFLAVLLGTATSSIVAVSRGATLLDWARDWALFAMGAFYFVFRSTFRQERDFRYYAFLLVVLSASLAVWGMFNLRQQVLEAIYAYQIRGVKGVNAVYLIGFFLSVSFYLYSRRGVERLLWALVSSLIAGGIVVSYTRTIWAGTIAALIAMVVLLPWQQRRRLLAGIAIVAAVFLVSGWIVLGSSFPVVMQLVANRALTVKSGAKVASLIERRDESIHVLKLLRQPDIAVAGVGPANEHVYYDSYLGTTVRSRFVHNGLLALMFKFGIPLGIFIYGFHLAMVAKGIGCYIRSRHTRWEPYVLPFTLSLIGTTVMDWTTNAFMLRSGALFLAMLYAGVAIADRLIRQDASQRSHRNSASAAPLSIHPTGSGTP